MGHSVKLSVFIIMFRVVILLGVGLLLMFGSAAGVIAQQEPLTLTLTNLENRDFPEISAWLAVSDAGSPVENLTAENFEIFEDDQQLAAGSVRVEPASMADLRLVFAIDTSTTDAVLADAKAAVVNMMSKLGPGDKAALVSFGNKVNLEYDFTNNTTALQAAVNRLSPRGEKTALHQATIDAAAMLNEFSAGRKAIIIVTNSIDNTTGPSPDEVFARIQQSGAPLYIVGLGDKVQGPHPLKTQAALTGGQFFALKTTDSVQNVLLEVEKSLRKGYRVSFHSNFKADNLSHVLSINVSGAAGQGGTTGQFVATPGKIVVTPQGIAANQTVKGIVNLSADVVSPSPLSSVSYLLDDQLLAEVSTLPYKFAWDTTATQPGDHILLIKAVDQAGNQAQIGINLTVAPPLRVTVSTTRQQIELGEPATVRVKVEAATEVTRLDLLLDGKVIDSKTSPPYRFSIDSSEYSAGAYQVAVRAEDALGRVAQDNLSMTFVASPPPPPSQIEQFVRSQRVQSGMLVAAAGLAVLAIILLAVLLLVFLSRWYRKQSRRFTRLAINNLGNIQSRYSLLGKDAGSSLKFQFALDGAVLPQLSPQFSTNSGPAAGIVSKPAHLHAMAAGPVGATASHAASGNVSDTSGWFQTPFVEPGETLFVEMLINPRRPFKKETCAFDVVSQAIDQSDAPKIKEQGLVEIGGIFWVWRYLSYLLVIAAMGWVIWQIVSLALWRLLEVDTAQLLSLIW